MVTDAMSLISAADSVGRADRTQRIQRTQPKTSVDPLGFFNEYSGHIQRSLNLIYSLEGYDVDYSFEMRRALETYTLRDRMKGASKENGTQILDRVGAALQSNADAKPLEVPFALDTKSVAGKVLPETTGVEAQLTRSQATVEFFR